MFHLRVSFLLGTAHNLLKKREKNAVHLRDGFWGAMNETPIGCPGPGCRDWLSSGTVNDQAVVLQRRASCTTSYIFLLCTPWDCSINQLSCCHLGTYCHGDVLFVNLELLVESFDFLKQLSCPFSSDYGGDCHFASLCS